MPRARKPQVVPVPQYPTGLPYGQAKKLAAQSAALPGGRPRAPMPPPVAAMAPGPAAPPPVSDDQVRQMLAGLPTVGPLGRPSERPGEPITAGLDAGPGPGSEVLGYVRDRLGPRALLAQVVAETGDQSLAQVLALVNAAEQNRSVY